MIDSKKCLTLLNGAYKDIDNLTASFVRTYDRDRAGNIYAVRFFDLTDDVISISDRLHEYQDKLLGNHYFEQKQPSDLRWSYYLYFVTSKKETNRTTFLKAKNLVESDTEYARKRVVLEDELATILKPQPPIHLIKAAPPLNLSTIWTKYLNEKGIGYVLDEDVTVPEVVRRILAGKQQRATNILPGAKLSASETAATLEFLEQLFITGFRKHPRKKDFRFANVNLVTGANGAGKTSLLEAIEYLFCGQLQRGGRVPSNTSVSATLSLTKSKLTTSTQTTKTQLRARNLVWYGHSELKQLTICDSFGKYNYLNTDAAIGLTLENSEEQIRDDVTKLLLGAQASQIMDRLSRVVKALEESQKDSNEAKVRLGIRRSETDALLKSLKKTPHLSDSLFKDALNALSKLKWIKLPTSKDEIEDINKLLPTALAGALVLERLSSKLPQISESSLIKEQKKLQQSICAVDSIKLRTQQSKKKLIDNERESQATQNRQAAIDSLIPFISANFESHIARKRSLEKSINVLSALISDVATLEPIEIGQNLLTLPLSQATRVTRTQFESLTQQLKELDKTIDALQQGKTKIALLEQTIRHAGKELVALNPELDHCPLCRSPFNKNELARRINSGTNEKTESAFAPLQKRKGDLTALCAKTRDELTALNALSEFVQGGNFEAETVKGAIGHLVKSRKQLVSEQEELRKLKKRLTALEDNGLTENDLRKCKNDAAIKGALPQIDAIKQLSDTLNTTLSEQKNAKQVLKGALKTLGDESTDLATKHGITATMDVDELAKAFNEQMTDIERALKATAELQFIFKYDATMAAAELTVKLEQLQSLVVKLRTAIAQEQKADAEIEVVTKTIAGIDAKLKDLESKLGRAKMAQKDFSALQRDHSGEALKTKILHENCEEIERIFSSIHSPSEFSLTDGNQSLQIIRRESNEKVGLHEMSTGQRAAYALSLFLSMNARLQEGPKVLIFDDPIAHIDDINILSFLDYLRDLALTEKRQIFFATADAKLAGIFRHKFRFLGEGKFLEIKLKYEE